MLLQGLTYLVLILSAIRYNTSRTTCIYTVPPQPMTLAVYYNKLNCHASFFLQQIIVKGETIISKVNWYTLREMAVNNSRAEMEKLNERIKELTAENEAYKACVSRLAFMTFIVTS